MRFLVAVLCLAACEASTQQPQPASPRGPATVHFTSPDGTRIGCAVSGDGPPLVLVHGSTGDHAGWAPVQPAFAEHFTVYACDRRGRGLSGDAADYALDREVEDLVAVIEGSDGPVAVFGHSYGAIVALEAARRTADVRGLVLYEPPIAVDTPFVSAELVTALEAKLAARDREGVLEHFLREAPRLPPAMIAKLRAQPDWQARVAIAHTIPREVRAVHEYTLDPARLATVKTPTLLLVGGDSPPPFRRTTEALDRLIPASTVAVLEDQQHAAIMTAPQLVVREVLGFLQAASAVTQGATTSRTTSS